MMEPSPARLIATTNRRPAPTGSLEELASAAGRIRPLRSRLPASSAPATKTPSTPIIPPSNACSAASVRRLRCDPGASMPSLRCCTTRTGSPSGPTPSPGGPSCTGDRARRIPPPPSPPPDPSASAPPRRRRRSTIVESKERRAGDASPAAPRWPLRGALDTGGGTRAVTAEEGEPEDEGDGSAEVTGAKLRPGSARGAAEADALAYIQAHASARSPPCTRGHCT